MLSRRESIDSFGSNPHPVRRLGAIDMSTAAASFSLEFQSSPSPKTGRYYKSYRFETYKTDGSNPHPVRRLGAMTGI